MRRFALCLVAGMAFVALDEVHRPELAAIDDGGLKPLEYDVLIGDLMTYGAQRDHSRFLDTLTNLAQKRGWNEHLRDTELRRWLMRDAEGRVEFIDEGALQHALVVLSGKE